MAATLALSAFALSLLGFAHCAAMCGGFVAAAHAGSGQPLFMHAGRIASYMLIGAAIGAAGSIPVAIAASATSHRVLFLVACVVLALSGLRMAGVPIARGAGSPWARAIGRNAAALGRRLGAPHTIARAFALGALWGWAPCALVYTALPLALVSGSAAGGALVMAAFGAGTLPALAGAGWLLARIAKPAARTWIGSAVVVLALLAAMHAMMH